jgi:type IV pilus assembly protein PilM
VPKRKKNAAKGKKSTASALGKNNNPVAKRRSIEAQFRRMQEKRSRKMRLDSERKNNIQKLREERARELRLAKLEEEKQREENLEKRRKLSKTIEKRKSEEEKREQERQNALKEGKELPLEEMPLPKPLVPADPNITVAPKPIKPKMAKKEEPVSSEKEEELSAKSKDKKETQESEEIAEKDQDKIDQQEDEIKAVAASLEPETKGEESTRRSQTGVRRIHTGGLRSSGKRSRQKKKTKHRQKPAKKAFKIELRSLKKSAQNIYKDYQEKKLTKQAKQNKEALQKARKRIGPSLAENKVREKSGIAFAVESSINPLRNFIRSFEEKRLNKNLRDVVGLDIGSSALRAVYFSTNGETLLAERHLPEGIITAGVLQDEDKLKEEIKTLWQKAGIPSKKVGFSLANELLTVRTIFLPTGDSDDIKSALALNADAIISPMNAEESIIDYRNLLRSGRDVAVQVVAADKEIAKAYSQSVRDAGLFPIFAQAGTLAAAKTLVIPRSPNGSHALIDIGAETTKVLACSGPDVFYLRVIPIAGNHFTRAIMKETGLTWEESERLKLEVSSGIDNSLQDEVLRAQSPIADRLAQEILQSKDSYSMSNIGKKRPMQGCIFVGGGSLLAGVREQVQFFAGFSEVIPMKSNTEIKDEETISLFSSGIGLALEEEGSLLPSERKNLLRPALRPRISSAKDKKRLISRNNRRVSPLILSLLLSVLVLTGGVLWSDSVKSENEALRADISLQRKIAPQSSIPWSAIADLSQKKRANVLDIKKIKSEQSILFSWQGGLDSFRAALTKSGVSVKEITVLRSGKVKNIRVVIANAQG